MLLRELCKTLFKIALKGENITGKNIILDNVTKITGKVFRLFFYY
jgi:hypothetical protein